MKFGRPFWPPHTPQLNTTDPRFQFLNLHAYGKPGWLLTHVFPPYSNHYKHLMRDLGEDGGDAVPAREGGGEDLRNSNYTTSINDVSDCREPTDQPIIDLVCKVLQRMFALPSPPVPIEHFVTRWNSDPFSLGSYSYFVGPIHLTG